MLNELDTVALLVDRPEAGLSRGETGAVVCLCGPDAFEIEFVALDGQTYAMEVFRRDELLKLPPRRAIAGLKGDLVMESSGAARKSGLARLWPFKR